jgi:hypothetical protein
MWWVWVALIFLLDNSPGIHEKLSAIEWLAPWLPTFHPETTHDLIVTGSFLAFMAIAMITDRLSTIASQLRDINKKLASKT